MFHNLYICSCITCCLIVYNYLYYHALCGAFSEIKKFQVSKSFKRLDSALKKVVPNISPPKKSRHFLMKLPDNFQMREHSRPCRFHISLLQKFAYILSNAF